MDKRAAGRLLAGLQKALRRLDVGQGRVARAAIARCKRDRAFVDAVLAAADIGLDEVRGVVEAQMAAWTEQAEGNA